LACADRELSGHRWHPSHGSDEHEYAGRRRVLFCNERDAHGGEPKALRLPPYPPKHPRRRGREAEVRGVRLPGAREAEPARRRLKQSIAAEAHGQPHAPEAA
jgi:hypothetical protein